MRPQAHSPASLVRRLPEGVQGASGKPPACSNNRQLCRKKFPLAGLDAPTPAPEEGLQPSWGTHLLRRRSEGGAGGRAESPLLASWATTLSQEIPLWRGLTRRLRREERACSPMGRSIASGGDPKGCRGRAESHPACMTRDNFAVRNSPLRGLDAPTPARGEGLQPYGALYCFRWRSEGVQGASGKPPACSNNRQLCRKKYPFEGA